MGGLPYHTTDKSLREHFEVTILIVFPNILTTLTIILIKYLEVYGDIEEAVVITDRSTGKSRGYGFVSEESFSNCNKYTLTFTQIYFALSGDNVEQGGGRAGVQGAEPDHRREKSKCQPCNPWGQTKRQPNR